MVKRAKYWIVVVVGIVAIVGCSRSKTIPDGELRAIFKEIFVTNAYLNREARLDKDSLDVYEPIVERHGYDLDDFVYTVGGFAKRKSMKLSDVLDVAIEELLNEEAYLAYKLSVIDTLNNVAQRELSRLVLEEQLIEVKRVADTAKLRIGFEIEEGTYKVSYNYIVDSLDNNKRLKNTFHTYSGEGEERKSRVVRTNWITYRERQIFTASIDVKDEADYMEILLGNYEKGMTKPNMTIDSLRVLYMLPVEVAADSLKRMGFGRFFDFEQKDFDYQADEREEKDSSTLYIDPRWAFEKWGGDNNKQWRAVEDRAERED